MSCAHPLRAYWSKKPNPLTGRFYPVFNRSEANLAKLPLQLPCGKCYLCRLAKSFEWSVRCTCESYFHRENYFLTLTYDADNCPKDRCLCRAHFQGFMKRLRYYFRGYTIKVFYCGEYGDKRHRPHYHAILFGLPLKEKNFRLIPCGSSKRGNINYYNPKIQEIWGLGFVTIGSFSSSAASYVAQYTLKKAKYNCKCRRAVQPFIGMSLRSPIGRSFFDKYYKDIFARDGFVTSLGRNDVFIKPFRFFQRCLEKSDPFLYWKYVERSKRRRNVLEFIRISCDSSAALTDSIRRVNLLKKESRLLRAYSERLDL